MSWNQKDWKSQKDNSKWTCMPPSFVQSIESMSFGTLFTASKLTWTTGHWKTLIFHLRTHASEVLLWPSKMIKFGNLLAKDFWKLFSRGFFSRKNASCIIHRPRLSTSLTRIRNLWGSQYSNLLQIVGEQVQHLPEMVILIKFIDFTKLQNQQTTHLQPTSKPPWNHHFLHGYQPNPSPRCGFPRPLRRCHFLRSPPRNPWNPSSNVPAMAEKNQHGKPWDDGHWHPNKKNKWLAWKLMMAIQNFCEMIGLAPIFFANGWLGLLVF